MAKTELNNIGSLIGLVANSAVIDIRQQAFQKLYLLYWRPLTNYATKITSDRMGAKDFVQDVFSDLWDHRGVLFGNEITTKKELDDWLLNKVRNLSTNYKKQEARKVTFDDDVHEEDILQRTSIHAEQEEVLEQKEYHEKMEEIVNSLPRGLRIVYNYKVKKGYNLQQISSEMGISVTQVREFFDNAKTIIEEKMMLTYHVRSFVTESLDRSRRKQK